MPVTSSFFFPFSHSASILSKWVLVFAPKTEWKKDTQLMDVIVENENERVKLAMILLLPSRY